jgi:hypothetical protein
MPRTVVPAVVAVVAGLAAYAAPAAPSPNWSRTLSGPLGTIQATADGSGVFLKASNSGSHDFQLAA